MTKITIDHFNNLQNMKTTKKYAWVLSLLTAALTLTTACNGDEEFFPEKHENLTTDTARVVHTAKMRLLGDRAAFTGDDASNSREARATSSSWKEGDKLYLQFTVGSERVDGTATYKASTDEWDVQYYGSVTAGEEATCEAYFFEGAASSTLTKVTLTPNTAIYADKAATYLLQDGTITVTAHLAPLTGRLRFKGESNSTFTTYGFESYTEYDITTNTLSKDSAQVSSTIASDGYTPYIYGVFANESNKTIYVRGKSTENVLLFSRTLPATALSQGKSGWLNLPTYTSRSGWKMDITGNIFTVKGITFSMILVKGGTFTMGATAEQTGAESDESPAHQVTLSDYYIAETEVTQGLWKAVTGYSPTSGGSSWSSSYGIGDNYPAYYISYEDVQSFITKLNAQTGVTFRMPTEAEWEYAARGGKKSKGYLYSGSNTIGNVAWYTDNSGSKTHPVATKAANELGLYDMSGNVWEWCSDWYSSSYYSSSPQNNPTGPSSGSNRVFRGGSWYYYASSCRVAARYNGSPSRRNSYYLGMRLASSSF